MKPQARHRRQPVPLIATLIALCASCAVVLGATASVGIAADRHATRAQDSGPLFAQTAPHGTLTRANTAKGGLVLRLRDVNPQVVWFTDRPVRQVGQLPIDRFAHFWKAFGFASDPPNAVLTLRHGDRTANTVVLRLGKPRYDKQRQTLSYRVRKLARATGNLSEYEADNDRHVPRRFNDASLFIDNADGTTIPNGCTAYGDTYTDCRDRDLSGADLAGGFLYSADFGGANLTGANLSGAWVSGVDFTGANLTGANLSGADLQYDNFSGAVLTNANFAGANLSGVTYCNTAMPDGTINWGTC